MSGNISFPNSSSSVQPFGFDKPLSTPSSKTEAGQGLTPTEAAASVKGATPLPVDKTVSPPGDGEVKVNQQREQATQAMVDNVMTSKAARLLGADKPTGSISMGSLPKDYQVDDLKAQLKVCTNRFAFRDRFDVIVASSFKKYIEAKESGNPKATIQANAELSKAISTYKIMVGKEQPQPRKGIGGTRDIELQQLQKHLEIESELHARALSEIKSPNELISKLKTDPKVLAAFENSVDDSMKENSAFILRVLSFLNTLEEVDLRIDAGGSLKGYEESIREVSTPQGEAVKKLNDGKVDEPVNQDEPYKEFSQTTRDLIKKGRIKVDRGNYDEINAIARNLKQLDISALNKIYMNHIDDSSERQVNVDAPMYNLSANAYKQSLDQELAEGIAICLFEVSRMVIANLQQRRTGS